MNREKIWLLLLAALLLAAMLFTVLRGGAKSRHGYGDAPDPSPRRDLGFSLQYREPPQLPGPDAAEQIVDRLLAPRRQVVSHL